MIERWWRPIAGGVGLLVCMNGPSAFVAVNYADGGISWEYWTFAYPFGCVAILGAIGLAIRLRAADDVPLPLWPLSAYLVWTLASGAWSVAPYVTPFRAITGVGIAAFGCWFGWVLSWRDQVLACVTATTAAAVASATVILLRPGFAKMPVVNGEGGEWRGIFTNRNSLAPACVLGLIAVLGLVLIERRRIVLAAAIPLAVLNATLLFKARSDTALISLGLVIVAAIIVPLLWWFRRRRVPGALVASGAIGLLAVAWVVVFRNFTALAEAVGKDPTLSRRRLIWAQVRDLIELHPVRGYGYWAFWDDAELVAPTYSYVGSPYGSAHNSLLEVALGLGYVGLAMFLVFAMITIGGVFNWTWRTATAASFWWTIVLVFVVAENLTESFVLWHSYLWVLFVAAALAPYGPGARPTAALSPSIGEDAVV